MIGQSSISSVYGRMADNPGAIGKPFGVMEDLCTLCPGEVSNWRFPSKVEVDYF
jgi:hypothetical protein